MSDEKPSALIGCAFLLVIPVTIVLDALLFALLWRWFLIPLGAPAIGAAHALGLATILRSSGHHAMSPSEELKSKPQSELMRLAIVALVGRYIGIVGVASAARWSMS